MYTRTVYGANPADSEKYKENSDMDELLEILNDLHPEVDYESEEALLDDGILDEDDIDTIVTEVQENFDVTIDLDDVTPANFNSARSIYALIESLSE